MPAPSRPMDPDAVTSDLLAALSAVERLASELAPGDWERLTDCPGWDVHDVVAHIVGFEEQIAGVPTPEVDVDDSFVRNDIGRLNERWVEALRARSHDELLGELRSVVARRRAELAAMDEDAFAAETWSPVGTVPYARFMQVRTFDIWIHEQDIREAVGRAGGLDGPVVDRTLTEVTQAIGFVVAKRGGAPDGSSVRFVLRSPEGGPPAGRTRTIDVAVDGRARVVDEMSGEPTVTLTMDLPVFIRLIGGRRDPAGMLADGRVRVEGDVALGERIVANLGYLI